MKVGDIPAAIRETLSRSGELSPATIAAELGISVGWVEHYLPRMEMRGMVERVNEGTWWAK